MFKKITIGLFAVMVIFIFMGGSAGAVPKLLNYQGKLTDANNVPVSDQTLSFTFKFYNVASGGSALWTESKSITTESGFFNTILGDTTSIDDWIFTYEAVYLGVEVASDGEMDPRQRIVAAGYAINADMLDGYHSSYFATSGALGGYVLKTGDMMTGTLTVTASSLGVSAEATGIDGYGIYGAATSYDGGGIGGYFYSHGEVGVGVYAESDGADESYAGSFNHSGVTGGGIKALTSSSSQSRAVWGSATAVSGQNYGGYFRSFSGSGYGLYSQNTAGGWAGYFNGPVNVTGTMAAQAYYGNGQYLTNVATVGSYVKFEPTSVQTSSATKSIWIENINPNGVGIKVNTFTDDEAFGGIFYTYGGSGYGIDALGDAFGVSATANHGTAVYGLATSESADNFGGRFITRSSAGKGLLATSEGGAYSGSGYYAELATPNWAGYFEGPVNVTGSMTASSYYGDGTTLTGVATSGDIGAYVLKAGDTMTGTLTVDASSTYGIRALTSDSSGRAVYGYATAETGSNYGGYFESAGNTGRGVYGIASNSGVGLKYGGYFEANGGSGHAVRANATGSGGIGVWASSTLYVGVYAVAPTAVEGSSNSLNGFGLKGNASGSGGSAVWGNASNSGNVLNYGGKFSAWGTLGYGVQATALATTGATYGGHFKTISPSGYGLYATSEGSGKGAYLGHPNWAGYFEGPVNVTGTMTASSYYGDGTTLTGVATSGDLTGYVELGPDAQQTTSATYGVNVKSTLTSGLAYGGYFSNASVSGTGVFGDSTGTGPGGSYGGYFRSYADQGRGVRGTATATTGANYGGYFENESTSGAGLYAKSNDSGYYARLGTPNYAGFFFGPVNITGDINISGVSTASAYYGDGTTLTGVATSGDLTGYVELGPSSQQETSSTYAVRVKTTDSGVSYGGHFESSGATGYGVYGLASNTSGTSSYGGYFSTKGTSGAGIYAETRPVSVGGALNYAGKFSASGQYGRGVYGETVTTMATSVGYGGQFKSVGGPGSAGISAEATRSTGLTYGGIFKTLSSGGYGLQAENTNTGTLVNLATP
jgi:hypothetical protein